MLSFCWSTCQQQKGDSCVQNSTIASWGKQQQQQSQLLSQQANYKHQGSGAALRDLALGSGVVQVKESMNAACEHGAERAMFYKSSRGHKGSSWKATAEDSKRLIFKISARCMHLQGHLRGHVGVASASVEIPLLFHHLFLCFTLIMMTVFECF